MGEIELWFFECADCKRDFPIVANAHTEDCKEFSTLDEVKNTVKHCPYCGSRKIKLKQEYEEYFG